MESIKNISCVGAGLIGHSWAALFAMKGYNVNLFSRSERTRSKAFESIKLSLNFLAEEDLITGENAETALGRINITSELAEAVSEADYIQESVVESYEIKKKIVRDISIKAPEEAIIASSTSSLLMTKIQKAANKPERCIVVHPLNPPILIPLVELVPGEETSKVTVELVYDFMRKLGKVPVVLKKEILGFIVNRLQAAVWREAISLVDMDVASVEDVDKALYAGLGIRWAFMGANLTLHLGGGEGGIEYFIKHLEPTFSRIWEDMETWTRISPSKSKKIIEGVKKSSLVRGKTMQELARWRDHKLIKILKLLYET